MSKNIIVNSQEDQQKRLSTKNINQQLKNLAVHGTGISPWEADVLVSVIEEVYLPGLSLNELQLGQIKYHCISAEEGRGNPLKNSKRKTVVFQ